MKRWQSILPKGITPARMAARSLKAINAIEKRIEVLAVPYADIDNAVDTAMRDLLSAVEDFRQQIQDTKAWLEEEME